MIKTTIFIKENMLFSILKLPFVQKVEINHMSKQSRTTSCTYKVSVILKDLGLFRKQLTTSINSALIDDKRIAQQVSDCLLELKETGKIKGKNFKRLCEYSEMYKFQIPYKHKYLEQIQIIKSLSINV